ncbi:MAG TPA: hypothetical protein DCE78_05325 [Bacteroidetes bacterium]|nr:hypothetical protein [Bacteroidota bacterium]
MKCGLFYLLFLTVLTIGCTSSVEESNRVPLALVGDNTLYLDEAIRNIPGFLLENDSLKSVQQFRDNWIRDQVLFDEALRLGLDNHESVQEKLKKSNRDILVSSMRDQILLNSTSTFEISNAEVSTFYEANRNQFVLQNRHVRVRHLFSETNEEAEAARNSLINGASWQQIVQDFAIDKMYSMSTDNELISEVDALNGYPTMKSYLQVVGLMEVSPIYKEDEYYHFIQIVEDRPPGDHPDLSMVFDQIKNWLQMDKSRKSIQAYEQNLYLQAEANNEIVIY